MRAGSLASPSSVMVGVAIAETARALEMIHAPAISAGDGPMVAMRSCQVVEYRGTLEGRVGCTGAGGEAARSISKFMVYRSQP